jgi:signal transduction histidine kinase
LGADGPPEISYDDDPKPAVFQGEPPRPVEVVEIPKPLPLPGQLKAVPGGRALGPEPKNPTDRVANANEAARVQPTRNGYINAVQVYPYATGALYQVYTAPGQVTDIALQEGEQLVGSGPVAAGDTVRWIIGDTESGTGQTKRVHIEVKPIRGEVRRSLDAIIKDGFRARDIIGRIRALIKKAPPQHDRLDINEVILEVIEVTRSEVLRNRVSLRTELAKGLPFTRGDRIQLQQVILNLIMNAIEALSDASNGSREGSRDLLISTADDASNGVLVAVRDSGPGLNPESLEHLFDPFYTTKPGGTGMGLSICHSIIEAHGGRIWASSNAPQGASFHFSLPADRVSAA